MKKIFFILLVSFFTKNLTAQNCCPYISNVELSPSNPTSTDSIYLITHVATPNQGTFLGYTITETDTLTTVEACYYNGLLTAIQDYRDTLNLGVHPAGMLKVKFIGWTSNNDSNCTYSQSQEGFAEVEVEGSNSVITPIPNSISIFPNPISHEQLTISSKIDLDHVQIFNQLGVLVFEKNNIQSHPISLDIAHLARGVYFLKIKSHSNSIFSHKIIKE